MDLKLQNYSKAIAAFLAGLLVTFLMKHNIIIADDLSDALEMLIGAIVTAVAVYLAPKNTEVK